MGNKNDWFFLNRVSSIEGETVVQYIAEAWVSLMRDGLIGKNRIPIASDDECIYAKHNESGEIIGCLTYYECTKPSDMFIRIGYVSEKYRRMGVYTALWNCLVEETRRRELKVITGSAVVNNPQIISFYDKVGRSVDSYFYIYKIPEKEETAV